jgi:phosphocarrier protein FPr
MIGLLLVSHSAALAAATEVLVRQMTGPALQLKCAAGSGENGERLGTDASAILAGFEDLRESDSIVVLMDIGSAILSTELARDLADESLRGKIFLSPAPFVEGAIAAGVAAAAGLPLARVLAEADSGLAQKQSGLGAPVQAETQAPAGISRTAVIADPQGMHLRPAAAFVDLSSQFKAAITLRHAGRAARGDSLTSLMALGAAGGATVTIEAAGPDAEAAAEALARLLAAPATEAAPSVVAEKESGPVPLSPGTAAGNVFIARRISPAIPRHPAEDIAAARNRLKTAIAAVRKTLAGSPILEAQAGLLADPAILDAAEQKIAEGRNEAAAWHDAITEIAAGYATLETPYLRERARDVREAGGAVLRVLLGAPVGIIWPEDEIIALVEDLTAAEAAALPANVLGVLDSKGGATSHATILLRAAGIPALGNVNLAEIPKTIAFDGATASVIPNPDATTLQRMQGASAITAGPSSVQLPDGSTLEFWANVAGERDSAAAARAGAFGIGLARTEILFLDRADAPTEDEQTARIAAMLAPFKGRPVTVRALDAGADKPVPFLNLPPEANPALGIRGIRALLRHQDFFATHLRAILRAGAGHDLRIMIPMVTVPDEMQATRALLTAAANDLGLAVPRLGAMIEVPAAAIRIQDFVPVSDFFSIGTNDLTQYVFAAERGVAGLENLADAGASAILDLIAGILRRSGAIPVSVCGEAAGDPRTARLLVQAGIRRLSMGAARLPALRAAFAEPAIRY